MAGRAPSAVLFACTKNAIRSPMAAALAKHYGGGRIYVDSAGVRPGVPDPMVAAVLEEIGIKPPEQAPKGFEDLEDGSFDLIISLSPEAQHRAVEMTRYQATELAYWPTVDPSWTEGSRDQVLESYRAARDDLEAKVRAWLREMA